MFLGDEGVMLRSLLAAIASEPDFYLSEKDLTPDQIRAALRKNPELLDTTTGLMSLAAFAEPDEEPVLSGPATVRRFLQERCDHGNPKFRVGVRELYDAYVDFCAANKLIPQARRIFGQDLHRLLGGVKKIRPWRRGHRPELYVGIRLRPRSG